MTTPPHEVAPSARTELPVVDDDVVTSMRPSFATFFAEQSASLVRLGYLLTGDTELAQDCAQDVMTALYGRWQGFTSYGQALGYARASVVNKVRDHQRRAGVARRHDPVIRADALRSSTSGDHANAVAGRAAIWAHLDALPRRQREVIVLRYWLDLSERDIAQVLGVRPGTVKTSASRALATLAAIVTQGDH